MTTSHDISAIRAQFPVLANAIYLNTGWSGPSPARVVDRVVNWLRWEAEQGPTSPPVMARFTQIATGIRNEVSEIFGATPDEIAIVDNTTEGINIVLNGLRWEEGDEVITCNLEHPSILVPLYYLRDRRNVGLHIVQLDFTDSVDTIIEKFAARITSRTRLIAISHISFSTGLRLPIERIIELAHDHGAEVLIDGAQSIGQIQVNFHDLGVDYYAFTGHKWLLGPEGAGALFIRRDRLETLMPAKLWATAALRFDMAGSYEPRVDSPIKFELTTMSYAVMEGFREALAQYNEIGPAFIEERTRFLGLKLHAALADIDGVTVISPADPALATGLVCFFVAGRTPKEICDALWERGKIVCRTVEWPGIVRAACHYYTDDGDLQALVEQIRRIAAEARANPE